MPPVTFQVIEEAAWLRHGSKAVIERLPKPLSPAELARIPDDRWLSTMTRRTFQAGLKHSLVDNKWPAFEDAFRGFGPGHVAALYDEDLEAMLQDARLVRHMAKLQAARHNAAAMLSVAAAHGSFGRWVAAWPTADITGLWAALATSMKQLGGNSAPVYLRMMGKDTFVPTDAVARALVYWQVLDTAPKTKADLAGLQAIFNFWQQETGKPLCHLSMTLAMSVD